MIVLQDIEGNLREVPAGIPYKMQPGERVVGSRASYQADLLDNEVKQQAESMGIPYGDYLAKLTRVLHIPHCSKCEQRKLIMNKISQIGWAEALRQVKELG